MIRQTRHPNAELHIVYHLIGVSGQTFFLKDTKMKKIIQNYLENAIKTDPTLCANYNASKVGECVKYIETQIRNEYIKANGKKDGCAFKSPEEVFKMARDFFIDGETERQDNLTEDAEIAEVDEIDFKPNVNVEAIKREAVKEYLAKQKEKRKAEAEKKAKAENEIFVNPNQVDLFAGV